MSAKRISEAEATAIEVALSKGLAPQKELLLRIFSGEQLSKALGGQWQRAVGARASHPTSARAALETALDSAAEVEAQADALEARLDNVLASLKCCQGEVPMQRLFAHKSSRVRQ